jgi:hypothetical protein
MATRKLKTISIKGKEYVEVKERILYLASQDEYDYSIVTDYQYFEARKMWVVKAKLTLYKDDKEYVYTGLAQEVESDNYREVNYSVCPGKCRNFRCRPGLRHGRYWCNRQYCQC